jgi:hypothetical protein
MKISDKHRSWQLFSNKLTKLWSQSDVVRANRESTHVDSNQFKARPTSPLIPGPINVTVNIQVLEKFVKATAPHISYEGFIASHLQHDVIDGKKSKSTKKSLAIERMVALVEATIADIKKIELNQISYKKG